MKTASTEFSNCHKVKNCPGRHPKPCERFASGYCKFQNECSHSHVSIPKVAEKCDHTETIDILEKIVREITLKFIRADKELKDVKETLKLHEISIKSNVNYPEEKETVLYKELVQPNPKTHNETTPESENDQESEKLKRTEQIQRDPKYDEKGKGLGKELLSCDKCDYQCKKENTLNKHRNTKHETHACKVCEHKSPSMVDILKHVADKHSKKPVQIGDIKETKYS